MIFFFKQSRRKGKYILGVRLTCKIKNVLLLNVFLYLFGICFLERDRTIWKKVNDERVTQETVNSFEIQRKIALKLNCTRKFEIATAIAESYGTKKKYKNVDSSIILSKSLFKTFFSDSLAMHYRVSDIPTSFRLQVYIFYI